MVLNKIAKPGQIVVLCYPHSMQPSVHFAKFISTAYLGAVQKSISSRIAEFGRYGGRGFITNPLNVTEWNLAMFSIIFYKVSSLDNVK